MSDDERFAVLNRTIAELVRGQRVLEERLARSEAASQPVTVTVPVIEPARAVSEVHRLFASEARREQTPA